MSHTRYKLFKYTDDDCNTITPCNEAFFDGASIWDREGEGLDVKITSNNGILVATANWPRMWNKTKAAGESVEFAIEFDDLQQVADPHDYFDEHGEHPHTVVVVEVDEHDNYLPKYLRTFTPVIT